MKVHTTNYINTFIQVADDCPAVAGEIPPVKGDAKTIASIQFELAGRNPYKYTSDDIMFQVFAHRHNLDTSELEEARAQFFSKGQPCFRASPLSKRYGWGVHSNKEGKVALFGVESAEYEKLSKDEKLTILKAMKSGK